MKAYGLTVSGSGKHARPVSGFSSTEFVMETSRMSLVERLIANGSGRHVYRFRLHTREPMRYEDTLDYDIACPRCGNTLRLCGRPLDAYDHGLYKCPVCDER